MDRLCGLFPNPVKTMAAQESAPEKRQLVAASGTEEYSCEFGSNKYFALCAFGGVLSCGITHTAVTPLDLVKCRLQVNKEYYKNLGNGFKVTVADAGVKGLFLGWAPTLIGYSAQGLCKFGFYEVFKNMYGNMMGRRTLSCGELACTWFLLPALSSLLTLLCHPWRAAKLGCRPLPQVPSPPPCVKLHLRSMLLKASMDFTRLLCPCGDVKFLTP
jgi:hypothetical protein